MECKSRHDWCNNHPPEKWLEDLGNWSLEKNGCRSPECPGGGLTCWVVVVGLEHSGGRNTVGAKIGTDSTEFSGHQLGAKIGLDWLIHGPCFYQNDLAYILIGLFSTLINWPIWNWPIYTTMIQTFGHW